MSAYKVVLVDDHARLRELYRIALSTHPDFEVVAEASDGAEGARLATQARADVVLLDLSMPNRDGLQALQDIKRDRPEARVVVLSGFLRDRVESLVLDMGANAYLEKGIPLTDIPTMLLRYAREPPRAPTQHFAVDDLQRRALELI